MTALLELRDVKTHFTRSSGIPFFGKTTVIHAVDGVTLAVCERVTLALTDLRERYSLEVSSPGTERPLTKPAHFRRFVGRRARVRTRDPHPRELAAEQSRRSFTGELVGASDEEVTIAAATGVIAIPYAAIHRSHLMEE